MSGLTDFHTHILPGVDDGSRNLEMSLAMLQKEVEQGVEAVVATPHFYARHDGPAQFLERRKRAEDQLRTAMIQHGNLPELYIGAEVAYYRGMSESDALQDLRIADSKYLLVEMPMSTWEDSMYEELRQIRSRQGLVPIIAHVDRYLPRFGANKIMEQLEACSVLIQANTSFFLHTGISGTAFRLMREGRIHLLGSDCHNLHDRKPNLAEAVQKIKKRIGNEFLQEIEHYTAKIL